ncbi:MAG: cytochrome c peroxidase [Methylococcales bacterium]|jgi:cytochrome c peroxidase|nr:c-type cytochrome [Methylococcaceae bacterium]
MMKIKSRGMNADARKWLTLFILTFLCGLIYVYLSNDESIRPIPDVDSLNPQQVELGGFLFNDVRLSKGAQLSCASCHSMTMGGADAQVVSTGVDRRKGNINSPSVFNSSLNFRQFWDGRAANLMEQVDGPIANPKEMDFSWEQAIEILKKDSFYVEMFKSAYTDGLTILNMRKAIVSFEESLLTPNSRFDLYLKGDETAISQRELEGYHLFKQYGCISCHQGVAVGGNLFRPFGVHGDYFKDRGDITEADYGRFAVTQKEIDRFVFKVPSLRNIELTAPYFHDGSQETLLAAVNIMMKYQLGRVPKENSSLLIVGFLKTLTGQYQGKSLKKKGQ